MIGSTKPPSQIRPSVNRPLVIQPAIAPQAAQYSLEQLPEFPQTLFKFRSYDGAKALAALLLLLATLYFLLGFLGFLIDPTSYLHNIFLKPSLPESSKAPWWLRNAVSCTVTHVAS
ncbi:hypothetical protein [Phormidesmis priestleyi]